jgi:hypothetical protein
MCLLMIAAALAGSGGAAAAAPSWQRPVNVSAPLVGADSVVVAMNLSGDTVVIWVDADNAVEAVTRRAGGAFSAPRKVAPAVPGFVVNYPAVAIDEAGNAIAVWQTDEDFGDAGSVRAAVLPASGRFPGPVTLSRRHPFGASVAMNAVGDAIVTWTIETVSGQVVQAAMRSAGGSFSRPIDLSADGQAASFSDVAMNAAGDAVVAWPRGPLRAQIMQAALRPAGGSFSAPINLSAPGQPAAAARVAIDPAGNAVVVWNRSTTTKLVVQAATRAARGAFAMPVDLSSTARDGLEASIAMDAAGGAIATWVHEDFMGLDSSGGVQASVRLPNDGFSPPVELSDARYGAEWPDLAMNPAGAAIVAWDRGTQDPVYDTGVQAAVRPANAPGGSFAAPVNLSVDREKVAFPPQVAIDNSGNAIAVWASARDGGSLQAAAYQAAPFPRPAGVARVAGLRLGPRAFSAARSGPTVKTSSTRGGSHVSYTLSIPARVHFTVQRASSGRIVAGRCAASSTTSRRGPRCTRFTLVPGSFTRDRPAGRDRFAFTGRVKGRRLLAGRYRLVAVPEAAGRMGTPARASFRIVR